MQIIKAEVSRNIFIKYWYINYYISFTWLLLSFWIVSIQISQTWSIRRYRNEAFMWGVLYPYACIIPYAWGNNGAYIIYNTLWRGLAELLISMERQCEGLMTGISEEVSSTSFLSTLPGIWRFRWSKSFACSNLLFPVEVFLDRPDWWLYRWWFLAWYIFWYGHETL